MDKGKSLLSKPDDDAEHIEQELVRLREDCSALIHELEGRYDRVMRVPREVSEGARQIEHKVRHTLQREAMVRPLVLVGGAFVFGLGVSLLGALLDRPRQRYVLDEAKLDRFAKRVGAEIDRRLGWARTALRIARRRYARTLPELPAGDRLRLLAARSPWSF